LNDKIITQGDSQSQEKIRDEEVEEIEECTSDGSVDRYGKPAVRSKTGRWGLGILILGKYLPYPLSIFSKVRIRVENFLMKIYTLINYFAWLIGRTVNQGLATLAFFGLGVNLVLFLTRVVGQSNADAANNVSKWTGTVYLFSLVGAFLSDSYWGRYKTCAIFQAIFVVVSFSISLTLASVMGISQFNW